MLNRGNSFTCFQYCSILYHLDHCRNNLRNMFQFQCLARNYLVFLSMIHWQWTEIKRCISLIGNFIWMHSTKVDYWNKMHCIAKTNALPSKCGILKIALSEWSFLMRIKRVFDWHSIIELHWKCFKQKKIQNHIQQYICYVYRFSGSRCEIITFQTGKPTMFVEPIK